MNTRNIEKKSINKAIETERNTSTTSNTSIFRELVKEIFTNMFTEQEEKLLNIVRDGH